MFTLRLFAATLVGLASASLPFAAFAAVSMNDTDSTFVTKAGHSGIAEVRRASLALEKSRNPHVIGFANEMRADHGKANAQLLSILHAQGVPTPSGVGAKNAALMTELNVESGAAEAANGSDPALVAFAKQTIPVIDGHIAMDKRDIASLGSHTMSMRMPGQR